MKPGSLVVSEYHPNILGIILKEVKRLNSWGEPWGEPAFGNKIYQWWEVWIDNKVVVIVDSRLSLI